MLEKDVSFLSSIVKQFIKEESIEVLEELSTSVKDSIENVYLKLLPNEAQFTTLLGIKLINPIRSFLSKHNFYIHGDYRFLLSDKNENNVHIIPKIICARNLISEVLETYRDHLDGVSYYEDYVDEQLLSSRDLLIYNFEENEVSITDMPLPSFKILLDKTFTDTIKYFKSQSRVQELGKFKQELFMFVSELKEKINSITTNIDFQNTRLVDLESKKDDFVGDWKPNLKTVSVTIDLKEHYLKLIENNKTELSKSEYHQEILLKLLEKILKTYLFLKEYELNKTVSKTVFGNCNFDKLKDLFEELSFFLDKDIKEVDFINVFTLNNKLPNKKINLINGGLSDFAFLIKKLQPFFVDQINDKKFYNEWWSDRFLFNGTEKTKKDISKIISALKADREAKFKAKINGIAKILE